ncbi:MAG: HNH endonuclease, partial [Bacteroidales bacterium]|nr:HNH endonuclease [Bacteroidales bacterium]
KGSDWGRLYAQHKDRVLDPNALEMQVAKLMQDSDVQRKRGIYEYVLDGDERHLDLRAFDDNTRREVYERQLGVCPICGQHFEIEQMEADHITPWCDGGRTTADNCQMLCRDCNRRKSGK